MNNGPAPIDIELQKSPPRLVRRRKGHGGLINCVHIFILPHTLAGIGVFLFVMHSLIVVLFGTTVSGHVTEKHLGYASKSGKQNYHVNYQYKVGNAAYHSSAILNQAEYSSINVEAPIRVKILPVTPDFGPRIVTVSGVQSDDIQFMFLWMLIWNGVLSIFWWMLLIKPLKDRALVIRGTACPGVILDKKMIRGKTITYSMSYQYEPGAGSMIRAEPFTGKMAIRSKDYDAIRQGMPVTVLYDPEKPKQSIAYQFSDYEAV